MKYARAARILLFRGWSSVPRCPCRYQQRAIENLADMKAQEDERRAVVKFVQEM